MGDMAEQNKSVQTFRQTCVDFGIRATHQRWEIYKELMSTTEHPDAETLFLGVRERVPTVSLDTVYRTLCLFEEKGLISRVEILSDRARFDGNPAPHTHAICERCSRVVDLHVGGPELSNVPETIPGFQRINSAHIELRGVCRDCAEAARSGNR